MIDKKLNRLSQILFYMAWITMIVSAGAPLLLLITDAPLVLAKNTEIWKTTTSQLSIFQFFLVFIIITSSRIAWIYAIFFVAKLARYYQRGDIFEPQNISCFLNIGRGLIIMGILDNLTLPTISLLFYAFKLTPWLADISIINILNPDLILSGAFFYMLGKIMQRGSELQMSDRLTV